MGQILAFLFDAVISLMIEILHLLIDGAIHGLKRLLSSRTTTSGDALQQLHKHEVE